MKNLKAVDKESFEEGYTDGFVKGYEKGMIAGKIQQTKIIAGKMLYADEDEYYTHQYTGLSFRKIKKLKKEVMKIIPGSTARTKAIRDGHEYFLRWVND